MVQKAAIIRGLHGSAASSRLLHVSALIEIHFSGFMRM